MGGMEISLVVAIDFTGSNGDPTTPQSLHHIDRSNTYLNQYQQAIISVGRVVEEYDTDKMFPVFGFGARCRAPDGNWTAVQHCFPLLPGGLEVRGIQGVLQVSSRDDTSDWDYDCVLAATVAYMILLRAGVW